MRWQLGTVRGMMESDLVRALGLGGAGGLKGWEAASMQLLRLCRQLTAVRCGA